jgi:tRNA(Ile)-lysidine synthase
MYIVAVSGGVDSVVLLDILARRWSPQHLVVAHFDHGIRGDSAQDRQFVGELARSYGLRFVSGQGHLGREASEALARDRRYQFLRQAKEGHGASHIATAHHQDDLLETAIINMLRGTGRKGLSSLQSNGELYRPLLETPKSHIVTYANKHGLRWREDSTNSDPRYLRNHVRQVIMPKLDLETRQELLKLIRTTRSLNEHIDDMVDDQLQSNIDGNRLGRQWFRVLPDDVAGEVMAAWLRTADGVVIDRKMVQRAVEAARTFNPGKQTDINGQYVLEVWRDDVVLRRR